MIDQCDISLICTICYSIHEDASFLTSCGHEFCDSCIRQWIDHAGSNPTCPMCRLPTSSSNVKPSHIIRGLIHEFRTEQNNEYGHLLTSPHFDVDKDITDRFSRLLNGNAKDSSLIQTESRDIKAVVHNSSGNNQSRQKNP